MEDITAESDSSQKLTSEVDTIVNDFKHSFNQLSESATNTITVVSYAKNKAFAALAKVDHIIYMQNGYTLLNGVQEARAAVAVNHQNCRLGKWYYEGDGAGIFSETHSFKQLESHHKDVHYFVQQAVQGNNNEETSRSDYNKAVLKHMGKAEEASRNVLSTINSMIDEKYDLKGS